MPTEGRTEGRTVPWRASKSVAVTDLGSIDLGALHLPAAPSSRPSTALQRARGAGGTGPVLTGLPADGRPPARRAAAPAAPPRSARARKARPARRRRRRATPAPP